VQLRIEEVPGNAPYKEEVNANQREHCTR
jgi:hypothetical protein